MTKSTENFIFGPIYWRNPLHKKYFLHSVYYFGCQNILRNIDKIWHNFQVSLYTPIICFCECLNCFFLISYNQTTRNVMWNGNVTIFKILDMIQKKKFLRRFPQKIESNMHVNLDFCIFHQIFYFWFVKFIFATEQSWRSPWTSSFTKMCFLQVSVAYQIRRFILQGIRDVYTR